MTMGKDYNKIAPEVAVRLQNVETNQAVMKRDITYLRETMDNHIKTALKRIDDKLIVMCPKVEESHKWIDRMQKYVVWPAFGMAAGAVLVASIFAVLRYCIGVV